MEAELILRYQYILDKNIFNNKYYSSREAERLSIEAKIKELKNKNK